MNRKIEILEKLLQLNIKKGPISADDFGSFTNLERSTASRYLNQLVKEGYAKKSDGRPVLYSPTDTGKKIVESSVGLSQSSTLKTGEKATSSDNIKADIPEKEEHFKGLIGFDRSLNKAIQKAKAAILYPPNGLHTLILGETGVGKSYFAKKMHEFSVRSKVKGDKAPFVVLNCADFADNPQLLLSQIFGSKKGAYTGADKDREGLLKVSDGGILFLDEVHRLPPQGQEMLFTYIDNGVFRELGSVSNIEGVKVQIIAATTEKPDSYLLDTFRRRIPMVIDLPPLRDRSLVERYQLISGFIAEESKRTSKSIHFSRNALISFLLYECKNNIGQLKSDIQLSCAKGFLSFVTNDEKYLQVRSKDIPETVKKGLFNYKDNRDKIDELIPLEKDLIKFHHEEKHEVIIESGYVDDFYQNVDGKIQTLKLSGVDEKEIKKILNLDLEEHFNSFISGVNRPQVVNNLEQIVGEKVIRVTNEILAYSGEKLSQTYSREIFTGLSMHIKSSIERLEAGDHVINPKLNQIRINHSKEFITAMECARIIENEFSIILPIDEIGYITMFLISDYYKSSDYASEDNVIVIALMHGNSTASSMVQVVNDLIGKNVAVALDMPLSTPVSDMYQRLKDYVMSIEHSKGVLLMVDMGSLSNFSDMLYEEEGIISKTIDMTSTPLLLEVARKAMMGQELVEIVRSVKAMNSPKESGGRVKKSKKLMILTACFTGEGAAERLKRILEERLDRPEDVEIKSINIMDRQEFLVSIDHYREAHNLIAVVSTIKVELEDIPVFNALEVLDKRAIGQINEIIEKEQIYIDISESIKDNVIIDVDKLINDVRSFIRNVEHGLKFTIHRDSSIGLILHLCFMVDSLVRQSESKVFPELNIFSSKYGYEMDIIRYLTKDMEKSYQISISDDEIAYITQVFINNKVEIIG